MKKIFIIIILSFFVLDSFTQEPVWKSGYAPELVFSIPLKKNLSFSSKTESFIYYFESGRGDDGSALWYEGTDIQVFINGRINPFQRWALGYQYGIEPGEADSHRTIQQYSLSYKPGSLTIGQRFRADQTFQENEPVRFRIRYRLGIELPLQGTSLDEGELYLTASDELLYAIQGNDRKTENRLNLQLGLYVSKSLRLQAGGDFRSHFTDEGTMHEMLVKSGIYLSF